MKRLLISIIIFIVWNTSIYLCFVFTNFEFNISYWGQVDRAILAFFGFLLGLCLSILIYFTFDKE